jgi:hypothetical protein
MKYFFLFLLCAATHLQIFGQEAASMIYSLERKLTWDDFSGEPDYADSTKAAQISTTIQLQSSKVNFWTGKARFTGSAIMYKNKSWVKEGFKNDYVLAHEQIHYDIAFLIAKKMEANINSLKVNIMNKGLIDTIYRNWHEIFILNEDTYDLMTDGGNNRQMQIYWHRSTKGELEALAKEMMKGASIR